MNRKPAPSAGFCVLGFPFRLPLKTAENGSVWVSTGAQLARSSLREDHSVTWAIGMSGFPEVAFC
jgi:hypothetical protein